MEGLGGIKLWKLLMKEDFFIRKIESANLKKARVYANNNIVAQLPRYYFELIFVILFARILNVTEQKVHRHTNLISFSCPLGSY